METNIIKVKGILQFDVIDVTNKHKSQSSWKKTAMIMIYGDICEYYSWFLKKRYRILLNKPLRNSHISVINDHKDTITGNWDDTKTKWNGKEIEVVLSVDPRTDSNNKNSTCHWWLNIPEEHRGELMAIREELGLSRPHWGLHMSLGYATDKNIAQSKYIHKLIINKLANE